MVFRRLVLVLISSVAFLVLPIAAQESHTPESCFVDGIEKAVECFNVQAPKEYASPESGSVSLQVIRVPSRGGSSDIPLVIFAGGPGQAASEMAGYITSVFKDVNKHQDILFIDQRGSGVNMPKRCVLSNPLDEALTATEFEVCRQDVQTMAAQLSTDTLARDVETVRQALGIAQLDLWGGSYGTFAAQHYAASFPEFTHRMILDAVLALDGNPLVDGGEYAQFSVERLAAFCREDELCKKHFPNWFDNMQQLHQALQSTPVTVQLSGGDFELDHIQFASLIRTIMYSPRTASQLPMAISLAMQDDYRLLAGLFEVVNNGAAGSMYLGLTLGVLCQEQVFVGQGLIAKNKGQGSIVEDSYYQFWLGYCGEESSARPDYLKTPQSLDVPTLLISGNLDPVTPPESAEQAMAYLPQATHLVFPYGSHINSGNGCMPELMNEFLRNGELASTACVEQSQPLPFATMK